MLRSRLLVTSFILLLLAAGCDPTNRPQAAITPVETTTSTTTIVTDIVATSTPVVTPTTSTTVATPTTRLVDIPLLNPLDRLTKKRLGTQVDPQHSPVSPERFTGFHTGLDFETTPEEADQAVIVKAICSGPLLRKSWIDGYGGLAVQSCRFNKQDVTVLYGHLKIDSITAVIGKAVNQGDKLGILGKGYSYETDWERKHLHLSIHKGKKVDMSGYVQKKEELAQWLDPTAFLPRQSP